MAINFKPVNYNSVSPYLIVKGAEKNIKFLMDVFDGILLRKFPAEEGGIMHSEIKVDDSIIMIADIPPDMPAASAHVHIYVSDVNDIYKRAIEKGAKKVQEPMQRDDENIRAGFTDAFGTTWWISTKIE